MIQLSPDKMKNAIERARAEGKNYIIRKTNAVRMYRVEKKTDGTVYTVNLYLGVDGKRYGACDCQAGQNGKFACKHLAMSIAYNTYLVQIGYIAPARSAA